MLFHKEAWEGIANGSITLAFRRWQKPRVRVGHPYRTAGGRIEVVAVDVVEPRAITDEEARRSGLNSADEVRAWLRDTPAGQGAWPVYRVTFRRLAEPDPRAVLSEDAALSPDDVKALQARLDKLDRSASHGPWTRATLDLIAQRPGVRAPELAASLGRETLPFKVDVRKLKALGLTHSLKVGYRLSPRGEAFRAVDRPKR